MNCYGEKTAFVIICKVYITPFFQRTLNSGSKSVVRQKPFCHKGNQNRVSNIGNTCPNTFNRQVIRQGTWTDDLYTVVKNEKPDWSAHKIVAVNQCIDQKLFKNRFRNLWQSRRINATSVLHLVQITHDKRQGIIKNLAQWT